MIPNYFSPLRDHETYYSKYMWTLGHATVLFKLLLYHNLGEDVGPILGRKCLPNVYNFTILLHLVQHDTFFLQT